MWRGVVALILVGLVLSGYAYAAGYSGQQPETSAMKEKAYALLVILNRTANFTDRLIAGSNISSDLKETLKEAENLRMEANELYAQGSYSKSIEKAKESLRLYRRIIVEILKTIKEPQNGSEILMKGKATLLRGRVYLERLRPLLRLAMRLYPNYASNISELYNETLRTYEKLALDLKTGNATAVSADLSKLHNLQERLDRIARLLVRHQLRAEAPYIAIHLEFKLQHHLKELGMFNGTNSTEFEKMKKIMERVHELIKEGKYGEALALEVALTVKMHELERTMHHLKGYRGSENCHHNRGGEGKHRGR